MKGLVRTIIIVAAIAVAAVASWRIVDRASSTQPTSEPAAEETAEVPVRTAPITEDHIEEVARAYGVIQARPEQSAVVSVPFESSVHGVKAAAGQTVTAGQPLIDVGPTPDAQLQFRQAEDALHAADRNVEQARQRREANLATNAEVATAEQAQKTAKTQFDALRERGAGGVKTLTAPASGIVSSLNVQLGQTVPAGTALLQITPTNTLEAKVNLDPTNAAAVKVGQTVDLRDVAAPADAPPLHGTVRQIAGTLDPQTRMVSLFVTVPESSMPMAGTFVEASFTLREADGLIVPREATIQDGDDWVVFTVTDGHAVRHVVKLGLADDENVQVIADDLKEDDDVVVSRNGELADKTPVTAEESDDEPATQPATQPAADAKDGG